MTGNDIIGGCLATTSYDFRLEITDKFKTSVAINTLPTAKVSMSWSKEGIGVGKIWEQGALDVGGDVYINNALAGYVVESGVNSNGDYVRFSNGLQICTILTSVTTDSTKNYVTFDVTFPASFSNISYVVAHAWYGSAAGPAGTFTTQAVSRATGSITGATYTSLTGNNFASETKTIGTVVIGRWK